MKTIKELIEEIEDIQNRYTPQEVPFELGDKVLENTEKIITLKEVLELIDNDISFQERQLIGDYSMDKPKKWRIIGMEELKLRIKGK